jgi:hypothetical protein
LVEESQTADRRRSNVVKEVERLKENREKRRAQQAQILEEKEALRNIDPGTPILFLFPVFFLFAQRCHISFYQI